MKAILCKSHGLPASLELAETPPPVLQQDEVLINVRACGVNFPDVLIIQNKYQFKPNLPFSPGGEVSGEIASVGDKVKYLKEGDRVVALCGWGGFAEQVAVKANRVFPMPQGMDFIHGACTLYTYGTSYYALKDRAILKSGETVLVLGAGGGVGLAAVELAKVIGARVIAGASSAEKLEVCNVNCSIASTEGCNSSETRVWRALSDSCPSNMILKFPEPPLIEMLFQPLKVAPGVI